MFTLVLIDDDIAIHPADLKHNYRAQLKRQIQSKYVDRIIPNVGLCVEFYDFVRIKDAHIYPGDNKDSCAQAYVKVEFNLVIFLPAGDEWLVGSITGSTKDGGINVSLGFFQDVQIPSSNLRLPFVFDDKSKCWVWVYRDSETKECTNYFYEQDALIRFRVISVDFPEAVGFQDKETPLTQMRVVGAADKDGLGCISWWPESLPMDIDEHLGLETNNPAPLADIKVQPPADASVGASSDAPAS